MSTSRRLGMRFDKPGPCPCHGTACLMPSQKLLMRQREEKLQTKTDGRCWGRLGYKAPPGLTGGHVRAKSRLYTKAIRLDYPYYKAVERTHKKTKCQEQNSKKLGIRSACRRPSFTVFTGTRLCHPIFSRFPFSFHIPSFLSSFPLWGINFAEEKPNSDVNNLSFPPALYACRILSFSLLHLFPCYIKQ